MSMPLSQCLISKAALGDEAMFNELVSRMKYNLRWGAYSTFPCRCDPPCPRPTIEQIEKLNERMDVALKDEPSSGEKISGK